MRKPTLFKKKDNLLMVMASCNIQILNTILKAFAVDAIQPQPEKASLRTFVAI
jgi:hypothetical protein